MSERTITDGDVVGISYVLTDADSGETLDQNAGGVPFAYLHGSGTIVKGLEAELAGKSEGYAFDVTLAPADAYGERKGPGPQAVKRSQFRRDIPLREGMRFKVENSNGEEVPLWITKVAGSRVYVDSEHPMVGRSLRFVGEVHVIRAATEEEVAHGHAHGIEGHAHHH